MEPGADPNAEASFVNPKAKIPVFVVNWSGGGGAASGAGAGARLDGGCERRAGGCEAAAARRGDDSDSTGAGAPARPAVATPRTDGLGPQRRFGRVPPNERSSRDAPPADTSSQGLLAASLAARARLAGVRGRGGRSTVSTLKTGTMADAFSVPIHLKDLELPTSKQVLPLPDARARVATPRARLPSPNSRRTLGMSSTRPSRRAVRRRRPPSRRS